MIQRLPLAGFYTAPARKIRAVPWPIIPAPFSAEPTFGDHDLSSYVCKISTSAPLPRPTIEKAMAHWPGDLIEV